MTDHINPNPEDAARAAHEKDMREMFAQELLDLGEAPETPPDPEDVLAEIEDRETVAEAGRIMSRSEQTLQAPDAPSLDPNASELSFSSFDTGGMWFHYTSESSEHEKNLFRSSLTGMAYVDDAYVSQETAGLGDTYSEAAELLAQIQPNDDDPEKYGQPGIAISIKDPETDDVYVVQLDEYDASPRISVMDRASFGNGHGDVPQPVDRPWEVSFTPQSFRAALVVENFATPLNSSRNPKNWTDRYIKQYLEARVLPLLRERAGRA